MGDLFHFPSRSEPAQPAEPVNDERGPVRIPVDLNPAGDEKSTEMNMALESAGNNRTTKGRTMFLLKTTQVLLLAVAVCFSVGATDNSGNRLNNLSHRLMCQCGCAQLLGECDHVGCPSRDKELGELRDDLGQGMSDQQVLDSFAGQYGAIILAAPTTHGFDLVAWIAPFAVFAAALLGTILLIRRWGGLGLEKAQRANAADTGTLDPAERGRREQIRHETGMDDGNDGGF